MSASPIDGSHAPRRILFVHHRSELGGAPASLYYLLQELDRERFEPHVYCPPGPSAELFRSAGATIHTGSVAGFTHIWASVYQGRRWLLLGRELLRLPKHVIDFRRVLRDGHFDLVHLNDSPLIPAALLAHRAGVPIVWHLRSALSEHGPRRSEAIRGVIRRTGAAAIAINEDVAKSFDVRARVIPNSIDLQRFAPGDREEARIELGVRPARYVVSYFGYIYPSKGFREFIRAAGYLRDDGLDVTFLVVGGAVRTALFFRTFRGRVLRFFDLARDYESEALGLVRDLGLQDAVEFVPFTRRPDMLFRATDVVVAPSRGPELGRPVIEAAASGIPVVTSGSRTGGGVVLHEETGLLVRDATPEAIAAAVDHLLGDDDRRAQIGRAARAHAERQFNPAINARRVEDVYDAVIFERKRVLFVLADQEGVTALWPVLPLLRGFDAAVAVAPSVAAAVEDPPLPLVPWSEVELVARGARLVHVAGAAPWTVSLGEWPTPVVWHVTSHTPPPAGITPPAGVVVSDSAIADDLPADWPVMVLGEVGMDDGALDRSRARSRLGLGPADIAVGLVAERPSPVELLDFARVGRLLAAKGSPVAVLHVPASAGEADDVRVALDIAVAFADGAEVVRPAAHGAALVVAARASGAVAVSGESAILVPPRAAATVAAAVDRLARDGELRETLGRGARDLALSAGDGALLARQIARIHREVAG